MKHKNTRFRNILDVLDRDTAAEHSSVLTAVIALADDDDDHCAEEGHINKEIHEQLVRQDWVLHDLLDHCIRTRGHDKTMEALRTLQRNASADGRAWVHFLL